MKPKIRTRHLCTALLAALVTSIAPVGAADLTWDHNADGTVSDGAGTWLNANQWWDGAASATWNNATPDNAIIGSGGVGGTITLGAVTAGTVTLNNFSGTYTLSGGSLAQSGGITVGSTAGDVTISTPVTGSGGLVMSGSGTLTLTGARHTGTTTVDGGTLLLNNPTINVFTSVTTVNSGGTLKLGAANQIPNGPVITVNSGGTFDLNGFAETITRTAGSGTVTNTGATATLTLGNAGTQTVSNVFGGALNLSIQGTSTLTLSGSSNYTGFTQIGTNNVAGTKVLLGANNALTAGTPTGINGSGNTIGLDLNGYNQTLGTLTLNTNQGWATMEVTDSVGGGVLTLTGGASALTTGNTNGTSGKISVTTLDLNNETQTFNIRGVDANVATVITSVIQNGSLTMQGRDQRSRLVLSGANTYTGDTTVNVGALVLDSTGQLKFAVTDSTNTRLINNGTSVVTLNGSFNIDTSAATGATVRSWTLVSGSVTYGGTFNVAGFTPSGDGEWSKTVGIQTWIFNQATGVLSLIGPAEFLAFGIPGSNGVIDKVARTISLTVPYTPWAITGLSSLAPTYVLSSGTCDQTSGSPPSPTFAAANPVQYVVTDGDVSNSYTVTVDMTPASTATAMTGVYFPGYGFAWASDETNFRIVVPAGASLSGLAPTFSISPFASVDTASGTARDFTSPQTYTVTAEDGSATTTYTLTVQKITNTGTGTYQQKVLASGPVSYWPLNETSGTTAFDIASGINPITYGGDFGSAPDHYQINQPGLRDDGNPSAQLIMPGANPGAEVSTQAPYHPSLNPLQFTVECWVKPTSTTGQYLVSIQDRTTANRLGYALWKNNGSAGFGVAAGNGTTNGVAVNGATAAAVGQSYHVVGTYDGTTLKLYVNGKLEGSANLTYMPATAFQPGFSLGSRNGFTASPSYMQDVAVYTRALTQEEILSHYNYNQAGYAAWAATHAPTGGANGDHDGDGVPNAVEYVLGGSKDTKDIGKLPTSSIDGDDMVFTFVRDQASIDGSTALQIQTSKDLATWDTAPSPYSVPDGAASNNPGVSVAKNSPVAGKDTVTLRIPRAPDASKFARMKVTVP